MAAVPPQEEESDKMKVVIAYDGSEHAEYALEWYKENVHRPNHSVTMIHVPELSDTLHSSRWANSVYMFDRAVLEEMMKDEQRRIRANLEAFAEKMKSLGLGGKVKTTACAQPGEGLVRESQGAQLVVVGSRGLGTIRRTLLGSVSDYLLHHCSCPVLVVKHPKHFLDHAHGEHHHGGHHRGDHHHQDQSEDHQPMMTQQSQQ